MSACLKRFFQRCCRKKKEEVETLPLTSQDKRMVSSQSNATPKINVTNPQPKSFNSSSSLNASQKIPPRSSPTSQSDETWDEDEQWNDDFEVTVDGSSQSSTNQHKSNSQLPSFASIAKSPPMSSSSNTRPAAPVASSYFQQSAPKHAPSSPGSASSLASNQVSACETASADLSSAPASTTSSASFAGMSLSMPRTAMSLPQRYPPSGSAAGSFASKFGAPSQQQQQQPSEDEVAVDYFAQMELSRTKIQSNKVLIKPAPTFAASSISNSALAMNVDDGIASTSTWGEIDMEVPSEKKTRNSSHQKSSEPKVKKLVLNAAPADSFDVEIEL